MILYAWGLPVVHSGYEFKDNGVMVNIMNSQWLHHITQMDRMLLFHLLLVMFVVNLGCANINGPMYSN